MSSNRIAPLLAAVAILSTAIASGAEWGNDYDKALAAAKAGKKFVLIDFTGSDWCGPCIAMKKNIFDMPEFAAYADRNLVLLEIDYPKTKSLPAAVKGQNERLRHQYGIDKRGYPTVALLDPDGKVLGEFTGYDGEGPADLIARISKITGR